MEIILWSLWSTMIHYNLLRSFMIYDVVLLNLALPCDMWHLTLTFDIWHFWPLTFDCCLRTLNSSILLRPYSTYHPVSQWFRSDSIVIDHCSIRNRWLHGDCTTDADGVAADERCCMNLLRWRMIPTPSSGPGNFQRKGLSAGLAFPSSNTLIWHATIFSIWIVGVHNHKHRKPQQIWPNRPILASPLGVFLAWKWHEAALRQ